MKFKEKLKIWMKYSGFNFYYKFVLGMPIRRICEYNKAILLASEINKGIQKYKNINTGRDIYIIGGGPSVKNFKREKLQRDVYIGTNRGYKDQRFEFDYLFIQDRLPEGYDEFMNYRGDECTKFIGIIPYNTFFKLCETGIEGNYERYVLASRKLKDVPYDVSIEPFADLMGTVFSAVQFALYTNPDHIFLVGMDCSQGNENNRTKDRYGYQIKGWKAIRKSVVARGLYDKLVSINPIGLKGFFTDIYTDKEKNGFN